MIEETLRKYDPEIIIGLGQTRRAKKIRIERRAVNRRSDGESPVQSISRRGPLYRYANLKLPACEKSTVTYDAGIYVCNFSMYVVCEYVENVGARFAFLHVPLEIEPRFVLTFLRERLNSL